MATAYSEKLKDPRWQKVRLNILKRDGFKCTECGSETETLHVHHKFYHEQLEPWEVSERALTTLCKNCHKKEEDKKFIATKELMKAFREKFGASDIENIAWAVYCLDFEQISGLSLILLLGDKQKCAELNNWAEEIRREFYSHGTN